MGRGVEQCVFKSDDRRSRFWFRRFRSGRGENTALDDGPSEAHAELHFHEDIAVRCQALPQGAQRCLGLSLTQPGQRPDRFAGRRVGLVLCGGNTDPRVLAGIMIRELARAEQIVAVRVTTPDRPGVLGEIATIIGALGGNILQVSHHRTFLSVPAKGTSVDISFETRDGAHAAEIVAALEARRFTVVRLPADEVLP